MSQYLASMNGVIDQLTTNSGWTQMASFFESLDEKSFPLVRKLAETAECDDLDGLKKELEGAVPLCDSADVKSSLQEFLRLLPQAEEFVTVTDDVKQ
jgi:hypothetical protein